MYLVVSFLLCSTIYWFSTSSVTLLLKFCFAYFKGRNFCEAKKSRKFGNLLSWMAHSTIFQELTFANDKFDHISRELTFANEANPKKYFFKESKKRQEPEGLKGSGAVHELAENTLNSLRFGQSFSQYLAWRFYIRNWLASKSIIIL